LGASLRLPLPVSPCLTVDVLASRGQGLNAGGHYRNITIPVGLELLWSRTVTPFAGIAAVFSTSDSHVVGFTFQKHAVGVGAHAGARTHTGPLIIEILLRGSTLESVMGPQPLGRLRLDFSLGFKP
jgi:hypothetical protein